VKEKKQRRQWSRKAWKISVILLITLQVLELVGVGILVLCYDVTDFIEFVSNDYIGENDRPDASQNINQDLSIRPEGWERIARNSGFSLGSVKPRIEYDSGIELVIYWMEGATYPAIDGSTVMLPLAVEFARQHLGMLTEEMISRLCYFSTTKYAYENLFSSSQACYRVIIGVENERAWSNRPLDLFLGTAPGEQELALAEEFGVVPVIKPICRDAFVFITHKDNPVDNLTLEQVRGIFSGKIKNWKEIGGMDEKIRAFQREEGSGSQTGMEQLVMQNTPMMKVKEVYTIQTMSGLIDAVAEYENSAASIGYSYRYYIDNQYKNENIKILKIDGIAPTDENIISGAYPLSVNYYGVIRAGEEDGPGGLFLDWILSGEGQACVKQAGYIPLG